MRSIRRSPFLILPVLAALAACGGEPAADEPAAAEARRVEADAVGIAITDLPAVFEVESAEGNPLVLRAAEGEGRLEVTAGEPETGINLVQLTKDHKTEIETRPGGAYGGQRELGWQFGTAFYSRGRFRGEDGSEREETVIFVIHPWGDRQLRLAYVYPAGEDTKTRIEDHLFGVLSEIEPLAAPAESTG